METLLGTQTGRKIIYGIFRVQNLGDAEGVINEIRIIIKN